MDETLDLLALVLLPGLDPRACRQALARASAGSVLDDPGEHRDLLGEAACREIATGAARRRARAEQARARTLGVTVVGRDEPAYPPWLAHIDLPPAVLFVRGRLEPGEGEAAIAVVGARAATPVGREFARTLAADLARAGLAVVSGLARGIDAAAHLGALDVGGRTIAVLGSGLDRVYPREHEELARRIAHEGAVVSEFPLGTPPYKAHFPLRNRVIAGWGRGVVVVEAGARSGAIGTANAAADAGRDVMAVPGHPSHPLAAGTNHLLRKGAALVRGAPDVLSELDPSAQVREEESSRDPVLSALPRGVPRSVDEIAARWTGDLDDLLARLTALEMARRIRRLPGALFVRS
jgi:DNA processing protein